VISAVLLLLAFIFWRNNKKTHKLNLLLQEQKHQVQSALQELKVTQSQRLSKPKKWLP
jgi:Flp pilus assembly protein TadB